MSLSYFTKKTSLFIWIIIVSSLFSQTLFADDVRIQEQLDEPHPGIPLRSVLGEKEFNAAMDSGEYTYIGNNKCRLCHRDFFLGRKKDAHDHAMDSLIATGHENDPTCLPCHTTGYGVKGGFISLKETPRLAHVQCEGCHGPGSLHMRLVMAKKSALGFLAGKEHSEKLHNMCTSCHTNRWDHSFHDLQKAYDTYRSADPNKKKSR